MNKIVFFAMSFLLLGTQVIAGQFGPAEAQTKPGQVALGVGVFAYADEWNFEGTTNYITDVRQTQAFIQMNLGLFPGWETYLQVGASDLRADAILLPGDFEDTYAPYGTIGFKGLFRKGKYVDLGGFVEGSYFSEYEDTLGARKLTIDQSFGGNAGLTIQKELEGAMLYGGPFFHYREADFSSNIATLGSGTVKADENFGGFLGIRWKVMGDMVVEGEVQLRNKLSAGAALTFLF